MSGALQDGVERGRLSKVPRIPKQPTCRRRVRRRHDDEVLAHAAGYRVLVENTVDLIVRGDAARNRTYVSPSVREVLGYQPADLLGKHAYELVHPDDVAHVSAVFESIGPNSPSMHAKFRMRREDGCYIWIEGRYRHVAEDGGLIAVLRDVTAQTHAEQRLAESNAKLEAANILLRDLAHRDGLTGLANRRRFDEVLDEEFGRARRLELPLGLVLLDVDYFKAFNDCYGHLAGDDCLRTVARAIEATLRRPGDRVARYGGEEMAAVLPATYTDGAVSIAASMREAVATLAIAHRGSPLGIVTISAGASSLVPTAADEPSHLIAVADRALYQAKSDGRNRVGSADANPDAPATPVGQLDDKVSHAPITAPIGRRPVVV